MNNNLTLIAAWLLFGFAAVLLNGGASDAAPEDADETEAWLELEAGAELESAAGLRPTDEEEAGQLEGRLQLFSDFCLAGRDHVTGDVKRSLHGLAGAVAQLLLQRVAAAKGASGDGAGETSSSAVGIAAAEATTTTTERPPEPEFKQPKATPPNPFGFLGGVARQVAQRLKQLGDAFGLGRLRAALGEACDRVGDYERLLRQRFELAKQELVEELQLNEEDDFRQLAMEQLGCVTLQRLLKLQGVCRFGAQLERHPLVSLASQAAAASD